MPTTDSPRSKALDLHVFIYAPTHPGGEWLALIRTPNQTYSAFGPSRAWVRAGIIDHILEHFPSDLTIFLHTIE